MPLLFIRHIALHPGQVLTFGVWQIAEQEWYFREGLALNPEEEDDLARYKGIRRLEWLAGRRLLHLLTGADARLPLGKNAFAKPFFLHRPELHCSLSHSHGIVGAMLAEGVCGCDLQVLVDKMPRLAGRFLHREEDSFLQTFSQATRFDLMHVYWTAKESLYKAYGLKELDFRENLRIEPFDWSGQSAETSGWVQKGNFRQAYRLHFEKAGLPPAPSNGGGVDESGAFVWTVCMQNNSET